MREKTKRRLFGVISTVIGIALSVAAIEGLAILCGTDCRYVDTLYPHPYVGFVHHANRPCGLKNINNVGLFNDDYPLLKRPDRYTILLTGGSVAGQLAQIDPWPAPHYLEEELNQEYESPNGSLSGC